MEQQEQAARQALSSLRTNLRAHWGTALLITGPAFSAHSQPRALGTLPPHRNLLLSALYAQSQQSWGGWLLFLVEVLMRTFITVGRM